MYYRRGKTRVDLFVQRRAATPENSGEKKKIYIRRSFRDIFRRFASSPRFFLRVDVADKDKKRRVTPIAGAQKDGRSWRLSRRSLFRTAATILRPAAWLLTRSSLSLSLSFRLSSRRRRGSRGTIPWKITGNKTERETPVRLGRQTLVRLHT